MMFDTFLCRSPVVVARSSSGGVALRYVLPFLYTVSPKNCANLFLSELPQISTNSDNFGRKMAKRLKLCEVHTFSTSSNLHHHIAVLNADVPNCYTTQKVVTCDKRFNDLISAQLTKMCFI